MMNSCIKQTVGPCISAKKNFVSVLNLVNLLLDKQKVLDSPVTISVIQDVIKLFSPREAPGPDSFISDFCRVISPPFFFVLNICLLYSITLTK